MSSPAAFRTKVVVLGEAAVGKTSLLKYFFEGTQASPSEYTPPTIGVDFLVKTFECTVSGRSEKVQVQGWDTAGQERFRTITPQMYRSTVGRNGKIKPMAIIVCYDLTERATFEDGVDFWLKQVRQHAADSVVTCIAGTKKDLADAGARKVSTVEGEALAKEHNVNFFFETSAYTGEAVEEMFHKMVAELLVRMIEAEAVAATQPEPVLSSPSPRPSSCAC